MLQICTSVAPFRRSIIPDRPTYLHMQGNGTDTWQTFTATGIPLARAAFESLSFYLRGDGTGENADAGTVGTPITDDVGPLLMVDNAIFQAGSAWIDAGIGNGLHYIVFTDANGAGITTPRVIVSASNTNMNAGVLVFAPALTKAEMKLAQQGTFTIKKMNTARFASISVYTEDLEP
jgi:hypothetical protein